MRPVIELVQDGLATADARDLDAFFAGQAPDVVWDTPNGVLRGHDEVRAFIEPFHVACPDGHHDVVAAYPVDDDTAVIEGVWSGTHTGPLATPQGEVPPTGRSVTLPFVIIAHRRPGTDVAARVSIYQDNLGFMAQLGLLPEPAAA